MNLDNLIAMSRRYGADPAYVLAGGGNTSYKERNTMAVKASGSALGAIDADGFVLMDAGRLRAMTRADYPPGDDAREACAIRDMMACRLEGQGDRRPSVECILHALFPHSYVLHVHPALVNGLTCGRDGARMARELFRDRKEALLWMPLTKPGFILSKACADAFEAHRAAYGADPTILLLQNHGIFVAGDAPEEIDATMADVARRLRARVARVPEEDPAPAAGGGLELAGVLEPLYGGGAPARSVFLSGADLSRYVADEVAAAPLLRPFTPDHIVYDKAYPLWIAEGDDIAARWDAFVRRRGFKPKVVLARGVGAYALGSSDYEAETAAALLRDAVRIAVYSEAFGGPLTLPDEFTKFILNWEIESYRQKKSFG
jgi:rhamnose utilization protein RhaD (predicted bifunctional aldolase and dehydrogenase)